MNAFKLLAFLFGTFWLGWFAYMALVVPSDVDAALEQPMEAIEISSIGAELKKAQADARQQQCDQYQVVLAQTWDRAVERDTLERDADKIDELERNVERFCG